MQCRSHVAQLGRLYKDFQAAGAEILVILGDTPEHVRGYAKLLKAPFPVLADPDRAVYHSYDLERAFIVIQRTASVVVDRQGVIQYMKRATNPMLWLQESGELLKFVVGLGKGAV
jgi:peroxiredoxin